MIFSAAFGSPSGDGTFELRPVVVALGMLMLLSETLVRYEFNPFHIAKIQQS